jgi:hypothetical protein
LGLLAFGFSPIACRTMWRVIPAPNLVGGLLSCVEGIEIPHSQEWLCY